METRSKNCLILERIGKVELITAGFIVENCRISSVHVLVYRETHGWEVKYPSFRDQFVGVNMIADYKLDKSIDGNFRSDSVCKQYGKNDQISFSYEFSCA